MKVREDLAKELIAYELPISPIVFEEFNYTYNFFYRWTDIYRYILLCNVEENYHENLKYFWTNYYARVATFLDKGMIRWNC